MECWNTHVLCKLGLEVVPLSRSALAIFTRKKYKCRGRRDWVPYRPLCSRAIQDIICFLTMITISTMAEFSGWGWNSRLNSWLALLVIYYCIKTIPNVVSKNYCIYASWFHGLELSQVSAIWFFCFIWQWQKLRLYSASRWADLEGLTGLQPYIWLFGKDNGADYVDGEPKHGLSMRKIQPHCWDMLHHEAQDFKGECSRI